MSVSTTTSKVQYTTNGSLTEFDFTFGVASSDELCVIYTDPWGTETTLVNETDYTVAATGATLETGGRITTSTTYPSGGRITIMISTPLTQPINFTEGMPTLYENFEAGIDRLTRGAQEREHLMTGLLAGPLSDETVDMTLPQAESRAGRHLGFGQSGRVVCGSTYVPDTLTVSEYMMGQAVSSNSEEIQEEILPSSSTGGVMTHDGSGWTLRAASAGDLLYNDGTGITVLHKGGPRKSVVMNSSGSTPQWGESASSLLTTTGDLLYASAPNTPARLAAGLANAILFMADSGAAVAWGRQVKAGSFTRDMTAASGNVSYTGIGFRPNGIVCFGANSTLGSSFISIVRGPGSQSSIYICVPETTVFGGGGYMCWLIELAGSKEQRGVLYSYDSDGFTISWTKGGTPSSCVYTINYIAWR